MHVMMKLHVCYNQAFIEAEKLFLASHYSRAVRIMVYKGSHQTSPYIVVTTDDHNDDPNEDDDDETCMVLLDLKILYVR